MVGGGRGGSVSHVTSSLGLDSIPFQRRTCHTDSTTKYRHVSKVTLLNSHCKMSGNIFFESPSFAIVIKVKQSLECSPKKHYLGAFTCRLNLEVY